MLRHLDRAHRLRLIPLQAAGVPVPGAPGEQDLAEVMHVVDASGRWDRGGAAWVRIAHSVPLLRPLAMIAELPVVRRLVEPLYRLVARNRGRLSRVVALRTCSFRGDQT